MNPAAEILELRRLLANLVRPGTIHSVDLPAARCRVQSGNLTTGWLPWASLRAGTTRHWSAPTVGEQCTLLAPGGELAAAVVLLSGYSDAHPAPSADEAEHLTVYPDGTRTSYHHGTHLLRVQVAQAGTVHLSCGTALVEADTATVQATTANLQADTFTGTTQSFSLATGSLSITADSGDIVVAGISHTGHTHGGVKSGPNNSGGPQ